MSEQLQPAGQFQPGHGAIPRKRGIAGYVREVCGGDPRSILGVLYGIAVDPRAKDADRIAAGRELLDRGWGKAVSLAVVAEAQGDGSALDAAIRAVLDDLRGAETPSLPDPGADVIDMPTKPAASLPVGGAGPEGGRAAAEGDAAPNFSGDA
jgi:hypothetical protein